MKIDWLMTVADAVAKGSSYGFRQVGAVIINADERILSTGYNGYPPGINLDLDRDEAYHHSLHAECNAMSCIRRGEAKCLIVTTMPCPNCYLNAIAHSISLIVYRDEYSRLGAQTKDLEQRFSHITKVLHINQLKYGPKQD